jgi:hypothetical protein
MQKKGAHIGGNCGSDADIDGDDKMAILNIIYA